MTAATPSYNPAPQPLINTTNGSHIYLQNELRKISLAINGLAAAINTLNTSLDAIDPEVTSLTDFMNGKDWVRSGGGPGQDPLGFHLIQIGWNGANLLGDVDNVNSITLG